MPLCLSTLQSLQCQRYVPFELTVYSPFLKFFSWTASSSRKLLCGSWYKKITAGKMSLTLVHGTGNRGWHIQYRESGRAKYFCQPSGFTVKRWGWRVHLGLDLNRAFWKPRVNASFWSNLVGGNHMAQGHECGGFPALRYKDKEVTAMLIFICFTLVNYGRVYWAGI